MNDQIVVENKEKISELNIEVQLLKKDFEHIKINMIPMSTLHDLQLEMSVIKTSVMGMQDDRKEDREAIKSLIISIGDINSQLEEYLSVNAEVLANQILAQEHQDILKDSIQTNQESNNDFNRLILKRIESMQNDIKQSGIVSQFKIFYNTNKVTKWIGRLSLLSFAIFIVSVFAFFTSGGQTFYEILNNLKELVA